MQIPQTVKPDCLHFSVYHLEWHPKDKLFIYLRYIFFSFFQIGTLASLWILQCFPPVSEEPSVTPSPFCISKKTYGTPKAIKWSPPWLCPFGKWVCVLFDCTGMYDNIIPPVVCMIVFWFQKGHQDSTNSKDICVYFLTDKTITTLYLSLFV